MSKFIERLQKVGVSVVAPLGFGASRSQDKNPALALVRMSGLKQIGDLNSHVSESSSGSYIVSANKVVKSQLSGVKKVVGEGVWGVWLDVATQASLEVLKKEGGDFFLFSSLDIPAEILSGDQLGKVMVIEVGQSEDTIRSIEDLPIDAIVLVGLEKSSPLTVGDILKFGFVRDQVSKPMLLLRKTRLSKGELEILQDMGLQGIVVDANELDLVEVSGMQEDIENLPPRKNARETATSLVPRIGGATSNLRGVDDDDDDEEEDRI